MFTCSTRSFKTDIHTIHIPKGEMRLDTSLGVPGKREDIRYMFGLPKKNEVTSLRCNLSFWNTGDSKSEELGKGRGDNFINIAYDGRDLHFEPNIPANRIWEAPAAYMLLRNGKLDYSGQAGLKAITGSNPRTMIGQDKNYIRVIIAEGRKLNQKGLTADEQRTVCQNLGLVDAINADGGGSSVAFMYDDQIGKVWDYRKHGRIIVWYSKYILAELPLLKKGKKGVYVHLLQRLLRITADGIFGTQTRGAVIAYQKANRLGVDGICGPQTWKRITTGII